MVRCTHPTNMKIPLMMAVLALGPAIVACGQSTMAPVARYTGDSYSAASPNCGTRRFAIDTGHFGRFYNCDCEEAKRSSPYIQWKSVNRCETRRTGWSVFRHDLDEVHARVRAGRCCRTCWPDWLCPECDCDCAESCGVGTNQGLILATLPPEWRGGKKAGYSPGDSDAPGREAAPASAPELREEMLPTELPAEPLVPEPQPDGQVTSTAGPRIVRTVGFHAARRPDNEGPARR